MRPSAGSAVRAGHVRLRVPAVCARPLPVLPAAHRECGAGAADDGHARSGRVSLRAAHQRVLPGLCAGPTAGRRRARPLRRAQGAAADAAARRGRCPAVRARPQHWRTGAGAPGHRRRRGRLLHGGGEGHFGRHRASQAAVGAWLPDRGGRVGRGLGHPAGAPGAAPDRLARPVQRSGLAAGAGGAADLAAGTARTGPAHAQAGRGLFVWRRVARAGVPARGVAGPGAAHRFFRRAGLVDRALAVRRGPFFRRCRGWAWRP